MADSQFSAAGDTASWIHVTEESQPQAASEAGTATIAEFTEESQPRNLVDQVDSLLQFVTQAASEAGTATIAEWTTRPPAESVAGANTMVGGEADGGRPATGGNCSRRVFVEVDLGISIALAKSE